MTAALSGLHPPPGGWTTDDLDELPEDGHRYELIDGVLIASPSPTSGHQKLASRITVHTYRRAPEGDVYGPTGRFDTILKTDEPWPMELSIQDITPRFYRPGPRD